MDKRNLRRETESCLREAGKKPSDVAWVGARDGGVVGTWHDFCEVSNFEYDGDFGGQEIANDLVVVFTDGSWLQRGEYDGSV